MKINKDIRKSNTLDGDFYCSNEMFEIVRKNILTEAGSLFVLVKN